MEVFKLNDLVVCIDKFSWNSLVVGDVYTIASIEGNDIDQLLNRVYLHELPAKTSSFPLIFFRKLSSFDVIALRLQDEV